ncbi:MAG: hypothetical protein RLZZ387_3157 [Chloroflexota bacterium]|jgi:fucose permease
MEAQPLAGVPATNPSFTRDRFTWTAYLLLGYFAYLQALLGPLMPFLRQELGLSYVVGSLHLSAFAAGMVPIGLFGDVITRRLGFHKALWGGAAGMAVGAIGLVLGGHVTLTIAATATMGIVGTLVLVAQQASLAHHHGPRRAVAFTEGNIVASLCSMLAPLAVGAAVGSGLGWRAAMLLPIPIFIAMLVSEGRRPVPEPARREAGEGPRERLPRIFWAYWLVACLSVAVEWSIGFWAADYLHTVAGLPIELAVTAMSVFFLSMLVGRFLGSVLTRRYQPAQLLLTMLGIGMVGVVLFWQAPHIIITLVGLAIAGLGVGNLYPFSLSVAVEAAPHHTGAASARMTLAGGLAILTAPLVLGNRADQVGLADAFAIVPALLACALVVAFGAQWATKHPTSTRS